ncbi:MAG: hypothetical protein R3E68_19075 [Burkholderiaceae bacterium]
MTRACSCRHRQVGQALLLGLALLIVGAAALILAFNSGQHLATKERLVHAADAAAFSAASWRARVFNYLAYSNRAIIAQEVAVAQALTLESWALYFEEFTETVRELTQYFPPAAVFTTAVARAAEVSREVTAAAAATEILLRDAPQVGYKSLLVRSQALLANAAGTFGAGAVALEVAQANDPRFFAFALPDDDAYRQFSRVYESDADRERLKDLVVRSLDPFSSGSRGTDMVMPVPAGCLVGSPSPADWFVQFRKRGGTHLAPGLDRWEAADTGSLHDSVRRRFFGGCSRREVYPIGWGATEAGVDRPTDSLVANPGGVRTNPIATSRAEDDMGNGDTQEHRVTGIGRVRELNYPALANDRFPRSRLVVLASVGQARIRDAAQARLAAGRLLGRVALPGSRQWAIAGAEVYFRRPPGSGRDQELASFYNPYWQARLAPLTDADRNRADGYVNR